MVTGPLDTFLPCPPHLPSPAPPLSHTLQLRGLFSLSDCAAVSGMPLPRGPLQGTSPPGSARTSLPLATLWCCCDFSPEGFLFLGVSQKKPDQLAPLTVTALGRTTPVQALMGWGGQGRERETCFPACPSRTGPEGVLGDTRCAVQARHASSHPHTAGLWGSSPPPSYFHQSL